MTSITESVTIKTPDVVIIEIAASFGINVDLKILEDVDNKKDIINQLNQTSLDDPDLTEKATFCNHQVIWHRGALVTAFENIMKYRQATIVPFIFEWGQPIPSSPLLIPTRILYRFCLLLGISPDIDDTGDIMYEKIMKHKAKSIIDQMDDIQVLKCFIGRFTEYHDDLDNNEDLEDTWQNLDSKVYLRNNYIPMTNEQSVVLAVQRFNIDISMSTCPIGEYTALKNFKNEYVPLDPTMKLYYEKNKDIFDIDIVFRNYFPEIFYKDIDRTAKDFGKDDDNENSFSFMETVSLTPTWYRGWFPCISSQTMFPKLEQKETSISLETHYLNENILLLVNSTEELMKIGGTCQFDTIDIMMEHFRINGLVSPYIKDDSIKKFLTNIEINRILSLCDDHDGMTKLIEDLLIEQKSLKCKVEKLKTGYFSLDYNIQIQIKEIFYKLLHASMFMRGWDGQSTYPVTEHDTPFIDQAETKACMTIFELHQMIDKLNKHKDYVLSIPLVMYDDGNYVPSRSRSDGYTLGERLFLLSHGNTSRNQRSCMRESSNWFATTAHMVLRHIDSDPGFDIRGWSWSN